MRQARFGGFIPDFEDEVHQDFKAQQAQTAAQQLQDSPPIKLSAAQEASQTVYKAVGALNQQGTAPGSFWSSPAGKAVMVGGGLAVLYVVGPLLVPVVVAAVAKRR